MQNVLDAREPDQHSEVFHEDNAWAGGATGVRTEGSGYDGVCTYPMRLNTCMTTSRGILEETVRGV